MSDRWRRRFRLACALLVSWPAAAEPKIVSLHKIWDQGPHNAFTDLIRFRRSWYCAFREGEGHVGGDGKLRVLASRDGEKWDSAALLAEPGVDLRDPKLSITPDGRLVVLAGGSVYEGRTYRGRQPRVAFSSNGRDWSAPRRILSEGDWLWRLTWQGKRGYGVSYRGTGQDPRSGVLYATGDGLTYERITELEVPGVSEVTLRFLPGDEMMALARRELDERHGWIGVSRPPYRDWKWRPIGHRLGGPNFIRLPDGRLLAGSRSHAPGGPSTVLARLGPETYEPILTLPSGGDSSYPGMVWRQNMLWMSYYSSHEGKTSVYLARIRFTETRGPARR